MTTTPNPTWYDVLGVSQGRRARTRSRPPGAPPPTSSSRAPAPASSGCSTRRPTCCSTRQRRAAYDASLDACRPATRGRGAGRRRAAAPGPPTDAEPAKPPRQEAEEGQGPPRHARPGRRASRPRGRAVVAAAVLAVLTVVAIVLAVVFGLQVRKDAQVADARDEAPAAAERAVKARVRLRLPAPCPPTGSAPSPTSPATSRRSTEELRPPWRSRRTASPGLAVQTKAVVTSTPLGSARGRGGGRRGPGARLREPDLARRRTADPQIFQNRVR